MLEKFHYVFNSEQIPQLCWMEIKFQASKDMHGECVWCNRKVNLEYVCMYVCLHACMCMCVCVCVCVCVCKSHVLNLCFDIR